VLPPSGSPLPSPASPKARQLATALRVTTTFADLLIRRGFGDDDRTRQFLDPKLANLTPPNHMADRDVAVDRISRGIEQHERIVLFGDYDCDGITSVAILTEVIRRLGGTVHPLLANRFSGGYGLSDAAVDAVIEQLPTLLLTCDCGSSDHDRLERLKRHGIDVVVIDHHLVPSEPLPSLAFLNPRRPDCGFGYKNLASCGLALSLAAGLRAQLDPSVDVRPWLDLVAVGTVADMVPLDGDNRALARAGMRMIEKGQRVGMRALAEIARVSLEAGVTAETISFDIAPRINAPGRLGNPQDALDLLLSTDVVQARGYAAKVEASRNERRRIQEQMLVEALHDVESHGWAQAPALVLSRPEWHPGVVGIVASQLVEHYGRPAVVIGFDGSVGRGSVRGPRGVSVYDLLCASREVPILFGGHHAAAGVTIEASVVSKFRDLFMAAAQEAMPGGASMPNVEAEVLLDEGDSAIDVVNDLTWLEPCGVGNEMPRIGLSRAQVVRSQEVRGGHLQVQLALGSGSVLYGFGPRMGQLARVLRSGMRVDATGTLRRDGFRGGEAVGFGLSSLGEPS
jgi:single-stranded-DNA-specific exonuclease